MTTGTASVAICHAAPERLHDAQMLSERLALPLADIESTAFEYLLCYTAQRLELRTTSRAAPGPIYADFVHGRLGYRSQRIGRHELLARAVGRKHLQDLDVVDATAGLGRDAFVLVSLGCNVTIIERSPIIAALVSDGLRRAAADVRSVKRVQRMRLIETDAIAWLAGLDEDLRPAVIYLDPMYPERRTSALSKKEMRAFRELVGEDTDAGRLLGGALARALQRVAVKRPRSASPLPGPPPDAVITGRTTRYDLYVMAAQRRD